MADYHDYSITQREWSIWARGEERQERAKEKERERRGYNQTNQSLAAERKVSLEVTLMSLTTSPWPVYCCTHSLVSTSQSFTVRSAPPVQNRPTTQTQWSTFRKWLCRFKGLILMNEISTRAHFEYSKPKSFTMESFTICTCTCNLVAHVCMYKWIIHALNIHWMQEQ